MAYTSPRTWVAGEIATASNLNTHVRDNIAWLATDSPCCSVYSSTTQTVSTGGASATAVNFNAEAFDNAAMHDTVSNTNRITVPSGGAGKYMIAVQLQYTTAITFGASAVLIQLNTTTAWSNAISEASGVYFSMSAWPLAAADWVTAMASQSSGSTKTLGNDGTYVRAPWFAAYWFRA